MVDDAKGSGQGELFGVDRLQSGAAIADFWRPAPLTPSLFIEGAWRMVGPLTPIQRQQLSDLRVAERLAGEALADEDRRAAEAMVRDMMTAMGF